MTPLSLWIFLEDAANILSGARGNKQRGNNQTGNRHTIGDKRKGKDRMLC